jgi:hypothetical protein
MTLLLSATFGTAGLPGLPYWADLEVEAVQTFAFTVPPVGELREYVWPPITRIQVVQALVLQPLAGICVKLNGSDTEFFLAGGGLLVLWRCRLDAGPQQNVLLRNPGEDPTIVRVMAAGVGIFEADADTEAGFGEGQ